MLTCHSTWSACLLAVNVSGFCFFDFKSMNNSGFLSVD